MKKRRVVSRDYKLAAVKKGLEKGLSVTEVARDLGIRDALIHNWKRAFQADGTLRIVGQLSEEAPPDAIVEAKLSIDSDEVVW